MDNPLMKKDLADSILELRNEVERRLMRNKYYVAIKKLDDLLEAIRPLEAEVIDDDAVQRAERAALTSQPVLESPSSMPAEPASEEIFAGPTQLPPEAADVQRPDVFHAAPGEVEAPPAPQHAVAAADQPVSAPAMPESLGNVYPAAPPHQAAAPHAGQPVEEVFQPSAPQHGQEQGAAAAEAGQARQPLDAVYTPRHSAAE